MAYECTRTHFLTGGCALEFPYRYSKLNEAGAGLVPPIKVGMDVRSPGKFLTTLAYIWLLVAAVPLSPGLAVAQGPDRSFDEAEAQAIDRMLMCPVCPAETIDQAQVELSRQMRWVVRDMLAQGATRDEILRFFVERYGIGILAAPPKSGTNLLAWIPPVVAVLGMLAAGLLVIRAMATRAVPGFATGTHLEDDLEPFPETTHRDLAASDSPGRRGYRQPVLEGHPGRSPLAERGSDSDDAGVQPPQQDGPNSHG